MSAQVAAETKTNTTELGGEAAKLAKKEDENQTINVEAALDRFCAAFDADKEAKAVVEIEPKQNELLEPAGEQAKNVQVPAGKAASAVIDQASEQLKNAQAQADLNVKIEALNLFNTIEKEDQADKVAKEATPATEENERQTDELLDQTGEVANQALNQAATTVSAAKEALVPVDNVVQRDERFVHETQDGTIEVGNEAADEEPKTIGVFDAGAATTSVRMMDVLAKAGKTAGDVKAEAINLVHKSPATEPQREESASGVASSPDNAGSTTLGFGPP